MFIGNVVFRLVAFEKPWFKAQREKNQKLNVMFQKFVIVRREGTKLIAGPFS